jgi:hypothetical protein
MSLCALLEINNICTNSSDNVTLTLYHEFEINAMARDNLLKEGDITSQGLRILARIIARRYLADSCLLPDSGTIDRVDGGNQEGDREPNDEDVS